MRYKVDEIMNSIIIFTLSYFLHKRVQKLIFHFIVRYQYIMHSQIESGSNKHHLHDPLGSIDSGGSTISKLQSQNNAA